MSSDPPPTPLADDQGAGTAATAAVATIALTPQVSADSTAQAGDDSGPSIVLLDGGALDAARNAAEMEAGSPDKIGDFIVAVAEDDIAVTVQFAAALPGYLGWHWSVTLAILSDEQPTISEVVLLPGDGALLAPPWIPWDQRIRPEDVGVGDLLPLRVDDPRVVPAYLQSDDPAVEAVAFELGIGRTLVLSREGRVDFAERLHDGRFGASDEMALAAPAHCFSCAFYLPLAGSLGRLVGACGNEYSPADGRVVDAGYGCGAHSETVIEMPARSATTDILIDELSLEVHQRPLPPEVADSPGHYADSPEPTIPDAALLESIDVDSMDPDLLGAEFSQDVLADAARLDTEVPAGPDADEPDLDTGHLELPDVDLAVPDVEVAVPDVEMAEADVDVAVPEVEVETTVPDVEA